MTKKIDGLIILLILILGSCTEKIDTSARYVFKERTIVDYLKAHPETYGMYVDMLYKVQVSTISETTVGQLLSARGNYTVFALTDEAIQSYLDTLAVSEEDYYVTGPSWDAFTDSVKLDSIRSLIVRSSIIDGGDNGRAYTTADFPLENGGEFGLENLNGRKLSVYHSDYSDSLYINKDCLVSPKNHDIPALNGYIHQTGKVILQADESAGSYFQHVMEKQADGYLVMARAVDACGLIDTLRKVQDDKYEEMYKMGLFETFSTHGWLASPPKHRLYGFTIFAETDDFWRMQGIVPTASNLLQQLIQWIQDNHQYSDSDVFSTDEDYSNPQNLLYQWVTYHILPMRLAADKLVIHHNEIGYTLHMPSQLGIPVYEYYTTMGGRRLLKLYESKESDGVYLNRFPKFDNGRQGTGGEIGCDMDKVGVRVNKDDSRAVLSSIANACIYPLDAPLSYNDDTRNSLSRERIRFDLMSLFPEAMTNDIRNKRMTTFDITNDNFVTVPPHHLYDYFDNLELSDGSFFRYANAYGFGWPCYQGDELLIFGQYDVRLKFPPVPRKTTYEVRIGYVSGETDNRGVAQCYFGSNPDKLPPTGIPLNMSLCGFHRESGWIVDSEDLDFNAQMDKQMHTLSFMKGPQSFCPMGGGVQNSVRKQKGTIRRVLIQTTLEPGKDYYLQMKNVLESIDERELVIDYFEYCPKEIYDNPNEPEDIW